jgi:TRAP-type uncharacterized transport system substrate-binding protein
MEFPKTQFKRPKFERAAWREWLIILVPAVLLVVAAFAFTSRFIQPAPPTTIVFSSGGEGGAMRHVRKYQEILKRDGITLDVRRSAGALENLARMRGENRTASAGFIQGGTTLPEDSNNILSLGRMFYEPVWVFHRLPAGTDRLTQLKGKRIAVGRDGSGTQVLAQHLLRVSDVNTNNSTLLEISGKEAISGLLSGKVDAAFFLAPPDAKFLLPLLRSPHVRLMPFAQAEAYVKHYPYLSHITLNQGVIDFKDNIPPRPVPMLAAAAILAVRDDVHPALQFLLVQAAAEVHRRASLIHDADQFPQAQSTELPMSPVAERFLKSGPPFLQRYLPFWLAVLVERLLVLLIPVVTVLIPLIKIMPMVYTWRIRRRLWYWYEQLKRLEHAMAEEPADHAKHQVEMLRIDNAVSGIPVPVHYSEPYYNLRAHIEYVQRRLEAQAAAPPVTAEA